MNLKREKGRYLTQSFDKMIYIDTSRNVRKSKATTQRRHQNVYYTRLRTNLERSVEETTATQLMC